MPQFALGGVHHRYDTRTHSVLLAEFLAVCKIPFNAISSDPFRRLQAFYCGSDNALVKSGLLVNPRKIRDKILPYAEAEARCRLQVRLQNGPMACDGYTYCDDSWPSYSQSHYGGVSVGRPSYRPQTVALCPVEPEDLHGVAMAKGWEGILTLTHASKPLEEYPTGFLVTLPKRLDAFVSDSAAANVRGRRILALRHSRIIVQPCFAHFAALTCDDLLTSRLTRRLLCRA
jgi:hypothetical protein